MNIDFSLFLPTRGHLDLMKRFLESVYKTTDDLSRMELLVALDNDDECLPKYFDLIDSYGDMNTIIYSRQRSPYLQRDYNNVLANKARGKCVWGLNDDAIFETKGWDNILREKIKGYKSEIFFIRMGGTGTAGGQFCHFPVISKRTVEVLGYYMHPKFVNWAADRFLHAIFQGTDNIIDATNVKIIHKHGTHNDEVYRTMKENFEKYGKDWPRGIKDFDEDIQKLRHAIAQEI